MLRGAPTTVWRTFSSSVASSSDPFCAMAFLLLGRGPASGVGRDIKIILYSLIATAVNRRGVPGLVDSVPPLW